MFLSGCTLNWTIVVLALFTFFVWIRHIVAIAEVLKTLVSNIHEITKLRIAILKLEQEVEELKKRI